MLHKYGIGHDYLRKYAFGLRLCYAYDVGIIYIRYG